MKNAKKLLLLLLALTLSLALFACGSGQDGGDGDEPESPEVASDVSLIENGTAKFKIVLGNKIPTDVRKEVDLKIVQVLKNEHGIDVVSVSQGSTNDEVQDIEVLIGDVTNRGEKYIFDRYQFGNKGYMIKIVDTKVVIQAGSDKQLLEAVREFASDVLNIDAASITNATMLAGSKSDKASPGSEVFYVQDDYRIDSLSVAGTSMKGYTIAADTTDDYYKSAALTIQDTVYDKTGYYFKIVKPDEATDKSIILKHVDKKTVSGKNTFTIKTDGSKLVMSCAYDNKLEECVGEFLSQYIILGSGNVNFSGTMAEKDISFVTYEEFGAVGDGKTDDFDAIYRTHEFANISGQTVKGNPKATYYIFDTAPDGLSENEKYARTVTIRTNVDWRGAKFIIDDTDIGLVAGDPYRYLNANIFQIIPDENLSVITLNASDSKHTEFIKTILGDGITRNTTKITIPKEAIGGWEGAVLLMPQNAAHKVYRRRGYGDAAGATMQEVIVVNPDGTISSETPVMFDFQDLTQVSIYRLDESTAIRVENGTFTTKACRSNIVFTNADGQLEARGSYISRGIAIRRSYTTLYNIKHYVEGEIELDKQVDGTGNIIAGGPAYSGFYAPSNANHILIENCILSGRRCYPRPQGGTTGTYDLSGSMVNYLNYKDCVQHNFWVKVNPTTYEITPAEEGEEGAKTSMGSTTISTSTGKAVSLSMHWGIGGTNWCKNMIYEGSTLSRFDAHQGLYNGAIIDSTINYIELTGNGLFEFKNSRWFSSGNNALLPLRADYGWTWEGEMKVSNVDAYVYTNKTIAVCYFGYNNWYFGYTCAFPSIELDNVDFYDIQAYYADWTEKPLAPGTEIWLTDKKEAVPGNTRMHLDVSHTHPYYSIEDRDKDGYVDEPNFDRDGDGVVDGPIDLDGDGKVGNTKFKFDELYNNGKYGGGGNNTGVCDNDSYVNLCRVIPPKYIKIVNNDGVNGGGGYTYVIWDTSGYGISDGGYYSETETLGGFFGGTEFIYDNGKFVGTAHGDQTIISPFLFRK